MTEPVMPEPAMAGDHEPKAQVGDLVEVNVAPFSHGSKRSPRKRERRRGCVIMVAERHCVVRLERWNESFHWADVQLVKAAADEGDEDVDPEAMQIFRDTVDTFGRHINRLGEIINQCGTIIESVSGPQSPIGVAPLIVSPGGDESSDRVAFVVNGVKAGKKNAELAKELGVSMQTISHDR